MSSPPPSSGHQPQEQLPQLQEQIPSYKNSFPNYTNECMYYGESYSAATKWCLVTQNCYFRGVIQRLLLNGDCCIFKDPIY